MSKLILVKNNKEFEFLTRMDAVEEFIRHSDCRVDELPTKTKIGLFDYLMNCSNEYLDEKYKLIITC